MTKPTQISRREMLATLLATPIALATANALASDSTDSKTGDSPLKLLKDKPSDAHRILTCNILLDLAEHKGDMAWKTRRGAVCIQIIKQRNPDIFCLQEVGHGQYEDFQRAFPHMASHGFIGPVSDAHLKRFKQIRNVIFYSKDRYDLTSASGYVLSDTPHLPRSRYPGVPLGRHVNCVRLRDRASGKEFRVLDTHLSLKSPTRIKETALIAAETSQYADDFPQIICGDFNSRIGTKEIQNMLDAGWKDTFLELATKSSQEQQDLAHRKIDLILKRGSITTLAVEYIIDHIDGIRPSDHNFAGADITL